MADHPEYVDPALKKAFLAGRDAGRKAALERSIEILNHGKQASVDFRVTRACIIQQLTVEQAKAVIDVAVAAGAVAPYSTSSKTSSAMPFIH